MNSRPVKTIFLFIIPFLFQACSKDESEPGRIAKRQMHFTFIQSQNPSQDSLVNGAVIKLYKNFIDFDTDTAVVLQGTSENGYLLLPGEDDGAAYYYRANHAIYGESTGSAVNAIFDDYYTIEFD